MNHHHQQKNPCSYLGFLLSFLFLLSYAELGRAETCSNTSSLIGFKSHFTMVQHQLRGLMEVIDDCSFNVSEFDMLAGADVHFWGAIGSDFGNLTNGFIISDHKFNDTMKNASFTVRLLENITWDEIQVLSVWDLPTASDFGHVLFNVSDMAPAPSPGNGSESGSDNNATGFMVPTVFDSCKVLSKNFRIRWTLDSHEGVLDIGLEAAAGTQNYMAFGWADPNSDSGLMIGSDVAVAGFTENGIPFVDDFFITKYKECTLDKDGSVSGVCPDNVYETSDSMNDIELVYGHRRDGVTFIRYRRKLESEDKKYDLGIDANASMSVIWALGLVKPPDTIWPYYLPQNHGGPRDVTYGSLNLNVSDHVNECLGPLDAEDKEDQELIIAEKNVPLIVTTGPSLHYPNPPNPEKVLYINKKEAPVLKVERGVPIKFSLQAGHDVAFYITSDLLGGNATLRNATEIIYAGGLEAEGVVASPTELVWAPGRNTPDQVYYHSAFQQKMGWRVQVVDGGLSDMYNNSVVLDDQQVNFFWALSNDSISIAARGEKKSGYLAIGFGSGMINSYTYVGWIDDAGEGHVNTYWIDGQDAYSIHPTNENLTFVRCKSENGIISMEFTRPLKPSCSHKDDKPECKNIIDPTTPLKVIWAMGTKWSNGHLTESNMHFATSQRPFRVLLMRGSAEAEQDLRPVLAVHGFMMFLAWGILLPGGILAARYLKHLKGDGWYQIHVYLQYSGLAICLLGFLFAVAEIRGFSLSTLHVKFGITAIVLACLQPVNASLRPKKPSNLSEISSKRVVWEYCHTIVGRCAAVAGIVALFTGMKHLGDRYDGEDVQELSLALAIWFLLLALIIVYLEYRERRQRRERLFGRSNWVLGDLDEDDSTDLLSPGIARAQKDSQAQPSERMEIQLEPLSR
ncbi:cytochrome b561, DM13 and DOMON domain-containing protein At5g54830 [Rutidosis leptorrhynchoides]|uniref:cytochrome b561, DM13 and DOMON domain-containing protein At5g54830 n=1 Tax=Rutidosis leptorrhynchoides TaxID=125765 RepID=UPI003A9A5D74